MVVNMAKTYQICISDSLTYEAQAYIYSGEGGKICSSNHLKLLGFHFGARPTCHEHVKALRKSFRGKYWLLIHLKQNSFTEKELPKV